MKNLGRDPWTALLLPPTSDIDQKVCQKDLPFLMELDMVEELCYCEFHPKLAQGCIGVKD